MAREMRMVEPQVNEMIDLLRTSANKMREVSEAMNGLASTIDNGALVGEAGDAFSRSLRSTLNQSIARLAEKLEERARYVEKERDELKRAMSESGALYTGS